MLALEYHRSPARYLAARGLGGSPLAPLTSSVTSGLAPLRLANRHEPRRPGAGWVRVRPRLSGICGSDLALLTGSSSPYLSSLVSMPFVPGHEVVGELLDPVDESGLRSGDRVVIDPVLSCAPRGLAPCAWCRAGQVNRCDYVTAGRVSAGLQTGFCGDTSGGWGETFVAHRDQLHAAPDDLGDDRAVLVEPLACAVRSVRRARVSPGASVVVLGAGTVGLFTVLALRGLTQAGAITGVAKHSHQRRRAYEMGATEVMQPGRAARGLRRSTGGSLLQPERGAPFLLGGADIAFECTGSGLDSAQRLVRAGGTVVLSGMPSKPVDLTPVWYRELEIVGSYASQSRDTAGDGQGAGPDSGDEPDFAAAMRLAGEAPLDGYVDGVYPLPEWRRALDHALSAGRSGSIKVAFDPRKE